MESLGLVRTHVLYKSEEVFFYRDEFVDINGVTRFFYCVGTDAYTHSLSNGEGEILNYVINKAFEKFDYEGIEMALIDFSSNFQKEYMH